MTFRHFTSSVIIQSVLLACTPALIYVFASTDIFPTIGYLLAIIYVLQIWKLITTVRKTNRELAHFIESFGFGDTTISFKTTDKDASFQDLFQSFNKVVAVFRQLKMDKEKEYLFFENALKNIDVAVMVANQRGDVLMSNKALLKLFNFDYIHRIDKLNQFKNNLSGELLQLKPDDQQLIEFVVNNQIRQVTVTSVMMMQDQTELRLFAFRDIHREIQQKEMESWQKLIRVLTHEVMNSLSPVNILSASLKQRLDDLNTCSDEEKTDWFEALDVIHSRSKGLTRFVENYRSIAGLHSAKITSTQICLLLHRVEVLFHSQIMERGLTIETICSDDLQFNLDEKLIEQVMINLFKNSLEAVSDQTGMIQLKAEKNNRQLLISIEDNGVGIPQSEIDKVCIPFYTTRENGNGIGLALTQQVMRLHNGEIKIQSKQGEGTKISLLF
nr:ATP-binding protein [uncultured Carboxylicivirga sp.]